MIRPRAGDFVFGEAEVAVMRGRYRRGAGGRAGGGGAGRVAPDGRLDEDGAGRRWWREAAGMGLTLHRAFDLVPDMAEALEVAVRLGFRPGPDLGRGGDGDGRARRGCGRACCGRRAGSR